MAIARRFKIGHDEVFPFGAYLVGEVGPVFDFEKSSKDLKVQQVDKDNGLPFRPVVFQGLTALPYIDDAGKFSRIVWSFKAEAMTAPGKAGGTTAAGKSEPSSSKAA